MSDAKFFKTGNSSLKENKVYSIYDYFFYRKNNCNDVNSLDITQCEENFVDFNNDEDEIMFYDQNNQRVNKDVVDKYCT